ncbi:histone-lysine N-methyltransferase ASHR1 isoform X3 [Cucumis melo var. makuwa]|uniref:Histone-lysine N-methyltransferase ASHR1 isoform X3 n=1 Tax=Cucumis melo var. makuwa TaxID=1194695 RepID=A0A5D3BF10_CUCMM|nr:histone-lysine N-methyltransferase ASHR1 isoform X3 [Cucumis melo var. makuwa]
MMVAFVPDVPKECFDDEAPEGPFSVFERMADKEYIHKSERIVWEDNVVVEKWMIMDTMTMNLTMEIEIQTRWLRYQNRDSGGIMVQTWIEERLEQMDQEIAGIKKEISKMPVIESSLSDIVKNLELMCTQSEKQQQMLLLMMELITKERSVISERMTELAACESVLVKGKKNEATLSKSAETNHNIGEERTEKKADNEEMTADWSKFKKVEMPVFVGEDPDSWLFRADRFCGRETSERQQENSRSCDDRNKGSTNFPIRTITLRSSNANEVRKEANSRRLPDAEFQARKEKGLCFRCNEYSTDHKCKMKELRELRMFVVIKEGEEYEIIEEEDPVEKHLAVLEVKEENKAFVELSINSIVGLNDPGTMKPFKARECENVEIQLANWSVKEDFLPLELGGVDIFLGMQWLHSLGVIVVDWKNLTLTFTGNGQQISIKGDPSLTKTRISLKSMFKSWEDQDEGFLIECRTVEVINNEKAEIAHCDN